MNRFRLRVSGTALRVKFKTSPKLVRRSTSEYFSIKGRSLRLYDCVIECHDTRGDMSAMPSMYRHSNDNIQGTSSTFIHMCQLKPNCLRAKDARTIKTLLPAHSIVRALGVHWWSVNRLSFYRPLIDFSQHTPWLT